MFLHLAIVPFLKCSPGLLLTTFFSESGKEQCEFIIG